MSLEEVTAFSDSHITPNIQDAVPAWLLSTHAKYDHGLVASSQHDSVTDYHGRIWNAPSRSDRAEIDISSTASFEDDASVSDSAYGSWSSEASSQTSYTSISDTSDNFLDDDGKDGLSLLSRTSSNEPGPSQEYALSGMDAESQLAATSVPTQCPVSSVARRVRKCFADYRASSQCTRPSNQPPTALKHHTSEANLNVGKQTCGPRRSAWSVCRPCPPKLKRDTDGTEQFVALLIIFAKRLITAIWPLSDRPPMMTDCFNGAGVLPLEAFIRETLRRSKTSFSTLQVALYYLVLLKSRVPEGRFGAKCNDDSPERAQCRAMQCGRRMFLSALMLASKYLQDRNYSARAWSKISGLRSNEINDNEREYLAQISYDLHLSKETFENWSKIVLVLSKLSSESPQSRATAVDGNFNVHVGSYDSLNMMLAEVDGAELGSLETHVFSDLWWTGVLQKLEPSVVREPSLVDHFLRTFVPADKMHVLSSFPHLRNQVNVQPEANDLNFSEAYKPRSTNFGTLYTPQTPVQTSPARSNELPSRPHLGNLPTPQPTPQISDQYPWGKGCSRLPIRCAASMDALRSLRKQCLMNANVENCPPPPPQSLVLPPVRYLMRSAETFQDLRSSTTSTSSPASVASDSTTTTPSLTRSRSSSISSMSSWSSLAPQRTLNGCDFNSPLSNVSSLSDRLANIHSVSMPQSSNLAYTASTMDDVKPLASRQDKLSPSNSEVDAIQGLMSLSTQSETPSRSVTPTPGKVIAASDCAGAVDYLNRAREHKRKLSKTEPPLQAHVRDMLANQSWTPSIAEDQILPYFGSAQRQMQVSNNLRQENRKPIATAYNHKRLCSSQYSSSNPPTLAFPKANDHSILLCR